MTISIIIPVSPGLVPKSFGKLKLLDWPEDELEIIVVEGTSPSRQRNHAVKQSHGDIICFLDDDSIVKNDYLQRITSHFMNNDVVVVGGPSLTPKTDSAMQQAIGLVLSSLLGAGGVRNRYRATGKVRETTERELIMCNLAIRRHTFLSAGGLDERLYPNEENELLERIKKSGGKLLHDPFLTVERSQRKSCTAFVHQMFRYGRGRAQQTRITGINGIMPFMPLFFIFYLFSLPFISLPVWKLPFAIYGILCIWYGVSASVRKNSFLIMIITFILFPVLHIANGTGLLAGFLLPMPVKACYKDDDIIIHHLSLREFREPY